MIAPNEKITGLMRRFAISAILLFTIIVASAQMQFDKTEESLENKGLEKPDIYAEYFRMRTHIGSIVGKSKWIARYSANKRGEVMGTAFNQDATAFFRFEGKLKPDRKGTSEEVVSTESYEKIVVVFSDPKGNVYKFDLISPMDYKGGSYTHKTYHHLLSSFSLYHYEINNKDCPYNYAHYDQDPEILQAARLLVKDQSDFIKRLEKRLQLPFGFSFATEEKTLTVDRVLEFTPAWYVGLRENDRILHANCDYKHTPLGELANRWKSDVKRLELLILSEDESGKKTQRIVTLYRDTPLEARLFQPPK